MWRKIILSQTNLGMGYAGGLFENRRQNNFCKMARWNLELLIGNKVFDISVQEALHVQAHLFVGNGKDVEPDYHDHQSTRRRRFAADLEVKVHAQKRIISVPHRCFK